VFGNIVANRLSAVVNAGRSVESGRCAEAMAAKDSSFRLDKRQMA
jgi:hypothetical protein